MKSPAERTRPQRHSPEAVRAALARVTSSALFAGSDRMTRFLTFVTEAALGGRAAALKEYPIGIDVFDRGRDYDPRIDPIVRVEARRLRAKLNAYYESEGRADDLMIELPKGSYVPSFRSPSESARTGSTKAPDTIAVLPFSNLSADPDNQYFSDGLTEELVHRLTRLENVQVVALTSAAQSRRLEADLRQIADQLNTIWALTGTVRSAPGRLRVAARLAETATGRIVWSDTWERRIEDLFAIQDEIAGAIARSLAIEITAPTDRRSRDLDAYNMYLKGRFHWNKRTPEGLRKGLTYFEHAIQADERFAAAHAGIADSWINMADYGLEPPSVAIANARAAAQRALDLDPQCAEAEASLGLICSLHDWNWDEGELHLRRSMDLKPGYSVAPQWLACDNLAPRGRLAEALDGIELSHRLDPLSAIIRENKGYVLMLMRRYDDAIRHFRFVIEFDRYFYKAYTSLGRVYGLKGDYENAIAMLEKGHELGGNVPSILGALGSIHAAAGNRERALELLGQILKLSETKHVPASCFALIHLSLDARERALDCLEGGVRRHELNLSMLAVHPVWDSLRSEPRFQNFIRLIGLVE